LLTDDQNVYFYLLMSPKLQGGFTNFLATGYELTVGGKRYYLTFNNYSTVTLEVGQKQAVAMNIYGADGSNVSLSNQAYVGRQVIEQEMGDGSKVDGSGYVLECTIPINALSGVSDTSGQTIAMSNNNLWSGSVEAAGGNTGAIILVGIGFVIAVGSVWKFSSIRKKRG
ncbi:Firmicu-CTERM sorting domain-containing protein, partial [Secundilactobacillus oryzae]